MNEPRVRIILKILYGVQAERLARIVSNSRVCGE